MEELLNILAHGDDDQILARLYPPRPKSEPGGQAALAALQVFRTPQPDLHLELLERNLAWSLTEIVILRVPWLKKPGETASDQRPLILTEKKGQPYFHTRYLFTAEDVVRKYRRSERRLKMWGSLVALFIIAIGGLLLWGCTLPFLEARRYQSVGKEATGTVDGPAWKLKRIENRIETMTFIYRIDYAGHTSSFSGHYPFLTDLDAVPVIYDPERPTSYWVGRKKQGILQLVWNNKFVRESPSGLSLTVECAKYFVMVLLGMLGFFGGLWILYYLLAPRWLKRLVETPPAPKKTQSAPAALEAREREKGQEAKGTS